MLLMNIYKLINLTGFSTDSTITDNIDSTITGVSFDSTITGFSIDSAMTGFSIDSTVTGFSINISIGKF